MDFEHRCGLNVHVLWVKIHPCDSKIGFGYEDGVSSLPDPVLSASRPALAQLAFRMRRYLD